MGRKTNFLFRGTQADACRRVALRGPPRCGLCAGLAPRSEAGREEAEGTEDTSAGPCGLPWAGRSHGTKAALHPCGAPESSTPDSSQRTHETNPHLGMFDRSPTPSSIVSATGGQAESGKRRQSRAAQGGVMAEGT